MNDIPRAQLCPECKKIAESRFYPFCSRYCQSLDLDRWLSEAYIIPARENDEKGD